MALKDYVLTYKTKDGVVANLVDYYDKFIKNLDTRFSRYSYKSDGLVLCYFKDHNDINPSMGKIKSKKHKGVEVCHCFGCGRTADIVRLHQILSQQYYNKELTEKEACLDLCSMFSIPIDDYEEDDDNTVEFYKKVLKIDTLLDNYTIRDFQSELLEIRKRGVDLNSLNSACIKMIATNKKLYD